MGLKEKNVIEYGKLPPQEIEAEKSLLGAILNLSDAYDEISGIVKEESFYKEEHRIIFNAVKELSNTGTPIDLISVTSYLNSKGVLDKIGGAFYISSIAGDYSMTYNFEHHAKIIQQKFIQRELIRIGNEIMKRAYDDTLDIIEHLSFAQKEIENVDKFTINEGYTTFEIAKKAIKEIEIECEKNRKGELSGIPCALNDLNNALGGFKKRSFILIGARPGEGKTTHALNFAVTAARHGYWVNLYTYEMGSTDLFKIIMAGNSNVNRNKIRDGRLEDNDWNLINTTLEEINNLPIIWHDNPDITVTQIRSNTRKNKINGKCDFVIVDYIQLMPVEDKRMNREGQISSISRNLKKIAMSQEVPLLALAQLNRDVEKRTTPEVYNSDLRESGSLEQDADVILFLYSEKDEFGTPVNRYMKLSKHRNGKVGIFEYTTNAEMTKIFDKETKYEREYIESNFNQGIEPNDEPF